MIKKPLTLTIAATFVFTNMFNTYPLAPTYAFEAKAEATAEANLVAPLGKKYYAPGYEHIDIDPSRLQKLVIPGNVELKTVSLQPEAEKTMPTLAELTTENTYQLTDEEYYQIVAENRTYDVLKALEIAYADVGNQYPTGWSQPGECIMRVSYWQQAAGANWGEGGTPPGNYTTATKIPLENLQAGDVVQYIHKTSPNEWVNGVHTVLIAGNNWDGTYRIVESNVEAPGLVTKNDKWKPAPPAGFEAAAFRF